MNKPLFSLGPRDDKPQLTDQAPARAAVAPEIHAISMKRLSKIEAADDPSDGADDE